MRNAEKSFTAYLKSLISGTVQSAMPMGFSTINFYCENYQEEAYPCVTLTYINEDITNLPFNIILAQIDVKTTDHKTDDCNRIKDELLKALYLDVPCHSRAINILDYNEVTPTTVKGKLLWESKEVIKGLTTRPELRRRVVTLKLTAISS